MDRKNQTILQKWYQQYGNELYRTLCGAVKNADISEDIMQETFMRVAAHLAKKGDEHLIKNPRAFLYKVAYNELYTRHRRRKLEQHLGNMFSDKDFELADRITPEEILLNKQQLEDVKELIAQLPKRQQTALLLSREENLTHAEIAARVGIKKGSVKQHIVRALSMLRGAGYGQKS